MNKNALLTVVITLAFFAISCEEKIPGDPEKTITEYIGAIQNNNYQTIFALNFASKRKIRFIEDAEGVDIKAMLADNFEKDKADYMAAEQTFTTGNRWIERHFFPKSASFTVGEAYFMEPVGDDPVNVDYEKAVSVQTPVFVEYNNVKDAPLYEGRAVFSAKYVCMLRKLRQKGSVRIYSHDTDWFVASCTVISESVIVKSD